MKTFVRVLIILTALTVIGVIAIFYAIYSSDPEQQDVLEEKTFDAEVREMEIRVDNSRVDFLPSEDENSRVVLSGNNDDYTLETNVSGGRLIVEVEERSPFFNFGLNRSSTLQVFVPADGVSSLTADSTNGAIQANGISADDVMLEANNGRIELEAVDSETLSVETANGRIELTDMEADIAVRASNGRIIFTDVSGDLQAKANNGQIELIVDTLDFPVDFETNNGHIEIQTENEPTNARIESRVDLGSIDVYGQDSEQVSFGNGEVLINLVSNNGRIEVD
ncbi:hypothetical protein BB776_01495 [Planococcus salinarum]|uniref:DUF4097 domain-containing protein n=1 Tax=Planococcus salinarum TaxID=622695 RepID=A0ABX3D193_9BACL|nr:DUF4097 family beta strand repeat-containing protein [Planococcus salinarum]OHX53926.1 hypothetical protein BB776_01495 [Planococcus salinarum]TAA73043.1 hypothetical protein D2909_03130 [Planococcus salinarum]